MEKKILTVITILFFMTMMIFTFVSRHTAIALLPEVKTMRPTADGMLDKGAVNTDETGGSYVLAVMEEDSILGRVNVVSKVAVAVEKEKEDMVKIKDITEYSNFEFVIETSEEISDGDRVRRE